MSAHQALATALRQLEQTLRDNGIWDIGRPEPAAFESQQPFCLDTMTLPAWLRYVFIARLWALVDARAGLPATCAVAPAVEVWLKEVRVEDADGLLRDLAEVDRIVTEA